MSAVTDRDLPLGVQAAIDAMKSQLLIVLVNRLGGKVTLPAAEIDGTGAFNLMVSVDPNTSSFTFTVERK